MSTTNTADMSLNHLGINTKKIKNYSLSISVAVHLLMIGAVKYGYLFQSAPTISNDETYIDLGYQVLNDVPVPPPVAAKSEEMQDETSEVKSLQKEKSKPMTDTPSTPTYADVPYYKIKPKYPKDALEAGVEGNVQMTIDILEDGTVENIKVTGGEKVGTFEAAATRSVAKWKYKPFTDAAGNPIKKTNYLVRVDFKIKDEIATQ